MSRYPTLRERGARFTYREGSGWNWRIEVLSGDIDATDLDDEEFRILVRSVIERQADLKTIQEDTGLSAQAAICEAIEDKAERIRRK